MYLLDTNVISEIRKGKKANLGVRRFFEKADSDSAFLSVLTIGEIRRGVTMLTYRGDLKQADLLESWLTSLVSEFEDRILVFDEECAQVWGKLMCPHNQHPIDKQIAAIALIHGLDVVTRNENDFAGTGIRVINPFS